MLKKYQIPEINAVKPEKAEKIKEKANQPVREMSVNDGSKTLVFFDKQTLDLIYMLWLKYLQFFLKLTKTDNVTFSYSNVAKA